MLNHKLLSTSELVAKELSMPQTISLTFKASYPPFGMEKRHNGS